MTVDELIKKLARERKLSDEMIDIIKRSFQEGVDYAFIKYKLFLFLLIKFIFVFSKSLYFCLPVSVFLASISDCKKFS